MFFDITLQHFMTPLMQQWPSDQYQQIQCEVSKVHVKGIVASHLIGYCLI